MRWHLLLLPTAGLLAGALALPRPTRDSSRSSHESVDQRSEIGRLRAHFDSVDGELRTITPGELTPAQRASRATLISWLREYRNAEKFPRNDRYRHLTMPFFRDSRGILCAMAYLIDRSGRRDLVDRVARARNNAFIAELADDPDLRGWLDSVGLSVAEAGRIQPTYGFIPDDEDKVGDEYALGSILASGTSLATLGLNLFAPSRSSSWAGVIAGTVAAVAGAANLDGSDGTQKVATANLIIGGGAIAAGLYHLIRPSPARSLNARLDRRGEPRIALEPRVIGSSQSSLGLAMHVRF